MSDETEVLEKRQRPFLTVLSGNPDDTQVAALTALFAAMASSAAAANDAGSRERNMWGSFANQHRAQQLSYNPSSFRNVQFY